MDYMQQSNHIFDNHGRPVSYLRIAVTDRCNLRCFYCMPEHGIKYLPKQELLTYEELLRLVGILAPVGVNKIRITGGEPFVRKDLMKFIEAVNDINGINEIAITTNGVLTEPYIKDFDKVGIKSVNLSLDSLDRKSFFEITRRDELPKVLSTLERLQEYGIKTKINAVVMKDKNTDQLIDLAEYARAHDVDVRFIEEMPFNGEGSHYPVLEWHTRKIFDHLQANYPDILPIKASPNATAAMYEIPGFKGKVGIISAFSRTFCGTCNRIRLTAQGTLKTCLYDDGVLDIKKLLRSGASDQEVLEALLVAFGNRPKDGFEAEKRRKIGAVKESMSTIGG